MTARYVAIDTETTGLNPDSDEIIEVAAIAFDLDGIRGEFNTLVKPLRPLPYQIERLTGIEAASLATAPHFAAVAADLADFLGDSPIVGQSVDFDVAFLARAGVWASGPSFDTFALAQLLLPGLSDYSLRGIADHLQIDFPLRHRARADADAARSVFLMLRARLAELPVWLLHEVERLATQGGLPIAALLRELIATAPDRNDLTVGLAGDLLAKPIDAGKALNGGTNGAMPLVSEAEVLRLLQSAGGLNEFFPEFERRPQQEQMAASVTRALNGSTHLVVEAGTGTGKSLAYLLPAALHALRRQERVVVSTDTIGLQEQLIEKDLPASSCGWQR